MFRKLSVVSFAALLLGASPVMAACDGTNCYVMQDGLHVQQSVAATKLPDGRILQNTQLTDLLGNLYSASNRLPVDTPIRGSTGTDYSANAATVPLAGYVLLATVPVSSTRAYVEVQNQSIAIIQIVRDDGVGGNVSSIFAGSGGAINTQGGGYASSTFKGRVRVYGPTGSQVSVFQD